VRARHFLDELQSFASPEGIIVTLSPLLESAADVSRWRRAGVVAGCVAVPVLTGVAMIFGLRMVENTLRNEPGVFQLNQLLAERSAIRGASAKSKPSPDDRAFAIYIASHFRQTITNAATWSNGFVLAMINGENRQFVERSIAENPNPTQQEIQDAETTLKHYLSKAEDIGVLREPWLPLVMGGASLVIYVAVPALIAAFLFRGGLVLRGFGLAIVRSNNAPASRLRVFWRSLVAWLPVLLMPLFYFGTQHSLGKFWSAFWAAALVSGLAIASVILPRRGLQDHLAGTCLVPR